jgi:hypothetical protein
MVTADISLSQHMAGVSELNCTASEMGKVSWANGGAFALVTTHIDNIKDSLRAVPPEIDIAGVLFERVGPSGRDGRFMFRQTPKEKWQRS